MKYFQKNLWIVALLVFSTSLWAQDLSKEERRAKRKAFKKEVRAYKQKNIWPVLKTQRQKLDAVMSAADRQKVDDLRAQKKAARKKMRERRKEFRKNHKRGEKRPEPTEAQIQEHKAMRKAMRKAKTAAWEIADRYETTIEKLMAEMKPQHEQWRKDLKAIKAKHFGERTHKKGHHHKRRRGHHRMHGMRKMSHPLRFLLFNPAAKPKADNDEGSIATVVYPNPSGNQSQVNFTLTQTENVSIILMDANGKVLKEVLNASKTAGSHSQVVQMDGLKNGTYYLKIKTSAGTETKRVIKR